MVLAIPVLILGLSLSTVEILPPGGGYVMEGNSLLYGLLKLVVHGKWLPSGGEDVMLHPVAFAGWAGILVTSLNLIPAAQLDGGHIAYALLGRRSRYVTWGAIGVLLLLGIFWSSWLVWGALLFLISRVQIAPLDDVSGLSRRERAIAIALLVVFLLTFTPVPLREVPPALPVALVGG
jgi:membrane-associated protease RseP (regulator of RpoE activity)